MSELDVGAIRAPDGYFLTRKTTQRPFPSEPQDDRPVWAFNSTFRDSETTLRDQVLHLIRTARSKVFVTSFILGDNELNKELTAAADRLGGAVYVISELSEDRLRRGLEELERPARSGELKLKETVEVEKKRFLSLTTRGVAMRGHDNCHAKFIVVDDEIAWVGSANLETRAFTFVGEVGVVIRDPIEVNRLARLFARMWLAECKFELPSTARTYMVDEDRTPAPVHFAVPELTPGPHSGVVWTDQTSHLLLTNIHDVIASARTRLVLASFILNGMEARPDLLIDPVATAIEKGVRVDLLLRAENKRDRHRRDVGLLHQLGVRVVADDLNHAKAVIADDRAAVLFSANFDAKHGLDAGSGIEVGARLDGTPALPEMVRYFDHAIATATREYIDQPTARQLHDRLAEKWQSPWPLADRITVNPQQDAWERLTAAAQDGPVLWCREPGQAMELLAGVERFRLGSAKNGVRRLLTLPRNGRSSSELHEQWWHRPYEHQYDHGYCPVVLERSEYG